MSKCQSVFGEAVCSRDKHSDDVHYSSDGAVWSEDTPPEVGAGDSPPTGE